MQTRARFHVGQVIRHRRFGYRGVVANVDPQFDSSRDWYAMMSRAAHGQEQPRYYVLVDGEEYATYVDEGQLEGDDSGEPVRHSHLGRFFDEFRQGSYVTHRRLH